MSSTRRFRAAALAFGSAAATLALALAPLPARAVTTLGPAQVLSFSEWFAVDDWAQGITPKGTPFGAGGLYFTEPTAYSRALVWNGTTPVDISPGSRNYQCVTLWASDAGVAAGSCQNPTVYFVHSGTTTTLLPAGEIIEGLASNGTALVRYPDGAGTSLGLYSKGVLTRVTPSQPTAGTFWDGYAVNASGLVIGTRRDDATTTVVANGVYAFSAGTATVVDPRWTTFHEPMKLTDSGFFYGYADGSTQTLWHGTVSRGVWTGTGVPLAAPSGGAVESVDDVNESGVVVGSAANNGETMVLAARWSPTGALTVLSVNDSEAVAINASGVAVGSAGGANGSVPSVPAIWTGSTELHPLGASATTSAFQDISDTGKIVGYGPSKSDDVTWQLSG